MQFAIFETTTGCLHEAIPVRHRLIALSLLLIALFGTACSSSKSSDTGGSTTASGPVISIKSLMFMPSTLHIKAGTTVTWRNNEPITHTVTSGQVTNIDKSTGLRSGQHPDGRFNKTLKGSGTTFSYTFRTPGTYSYYCDIHFGMNAKIVVTP